MATRNAAILAARIIAIYFGVQVAVAIPQLINMLTLSPPFRSIWPFYVSTAVLAVIACYLWIRAELVADRMTSGAAPDAGAAPAPGERTQMLAFMVVGLVAVVQAIPELAGLIFSESGNLGSIGPFGPTFGGGQGAAIGASIIRLAIGLLLLFRASAIVEVVNPRAGGSPPGPAAP
jgi:hypothetical protein